MVRFFAIAGFALLPHAAQGAPVRTLSGLDVFGVAASSITELERCFGPAARQIVALGASDPVRARELEENLENRIKEAGPFAAVNIELVFYWNEEEHIFLTFGVTRKGETAKIRFREEPREEPGDPGGLLAKWREYEAEGNALGIWQTPSCRFHHCTHGFEHSKLEPFGRLFEHSVPPHRKELVGVLLRDGDPRNRAVAAFLLAHLPRARSVGKALLPALFDPDPTVRSNVLRVLASMAERGAAPSAAIEPVLPFLASSSLADRNKASAFVAALSAEKRYRALLLDRVACQLVRLLEMAQPNQTEFAHRALVRLRGEDLGASDSAPWRAWLQNQGKSCRLEPEIGRGELCPLGE